MVGASPRSMRRSCRGSSLSGAIVSLCCNNSCNMNESMNHFKQTKQPITITITCLAEGFNTPASAGGLNLQDKRVDPCCWLRSGFQSP